MRIEEKWTLFHDFNRASKEGLVDPIYCPNDGFQLYLQGNDDGEPVLHCYQCGATIEPGTNVTARVQELLESI